MFFSKMIKRVLALIPLYLFCASLISNTMAGPLDISNSIRQFSIDLYQNTVAGNEDKNIIISPFSVQLALSLALMGAKGKTADEIVAGLKLSGSREEISNEIHRFIEPLQNSTQLKVANKIYVQNNYDVKPQFNEIATKKFHSEAASLDFKENVASANTINEWVESKTNNKIKNLISSDSLDADTRMVLVNAIYFKGTWQHQFPKEATKKAPFYTNAKDHVEVDMMNTKKYFNYGDFASLNAKAIELKYADSDLSMFILLPNERDGLAKLETDLKTVDLRELIKTMHKQEVELSLPKFKIEFEISLEDTLKKMGMSELFSNTADFSDLLESPEALKVSKIIHKAFIDVNEEGAEAAAATGLTLVSYAIPMPRLVMQFKADHSFLFYIMDTNNRSPIFAGRLFSKAN